MQEVQEEGSHVVEVTNITLSPLGMLYILYACVASSQMSKCKKEESRMEHKRVNTNGYLRGQRAAKTNNDYITPAITPWLLSISSAY
jgi:hypothetical protein